MRHAAHDLTLRPPSPPRGIAAVAMVVVLIIVDLIVVGLSVGLARDHDLTVRRMETVEALYACEAGMNMAIREMMNSADEDGDGGTGTISDDGNDANDPAVGNARFKVTSAYAAPITTLTSAGRCGEALRTAEAELEDP